jgi:hypothetical protein
VAQDEPATVDSASRRNISDFVSVAVDHVARYGHHSVLTAQEIYRRGLGLADRYTMSAFQEELYRSST